MTLILNEKDNRSYMDAEEYLALQNKKERGISLKKNIVDGTFGETQNVDGFEDLGSICVSKRFKPTITDLKLLIGTKEWEKVKKEEQIDENTIDHLEKDKNFDQQGLNDY